MSFDFKNSSPSQLKEEYKRIAAETADDGFFTKRELNHVQSILMENEQVLAFTSGLMDAHTWLIVLTDRRILFLHKGMIYGLKQTSIDLAKVNAVTADTKLLFGTIRIEDSARQRTIERVSKKSAIRFTNKTREALDALNKPLDYSTNNTVESTVSTLEKLLSLKERGVLNEEEFEEQKNRILRG
jgi:hypothetical protein